MLYNKAWDKNNPSLRGLIQWLETKNPDHSYDFYDCSGKCLIGQYMSYLGIKWYGEDAPYNTGDKSNYTATCKQIFPSFDSIFTTLANHPQTYGSALRRCLAVEKLGYPSMADAA